MYLQLSTLMRRRISVGEWPQDMRLPALAELMQEFGVARVTVHQALALLEAEGLVTRQQGSATFVTGRPTDWHWLGIPIQRRRRNRTLRGTTPDRPRPPGGSAHPPPSWERD